MRRTICFPGCSLPLLSEDLCAFKAPRCDEPALRPELPATRESAEARFFPPMRGLMSWLLKMAPNFSASA